MAAPPRKSKKGTRKAPIKSATEENAEQRRITAWAIKTARTMQGMSKETFARELTRSTGVPWSENMVSKLETGGKAVSLHLLSAIRDIQKMPLEWYFTQRETAFEALLAGLQKTQGGGGVAGQKPYGVMSASRPDLRKQLALAAV